MGEATALVLLLGSGFNCGLERRSDDVRAVELVQFLGYGHERVGRAQASLHAQIVLDGFHSARAVVELVIFLFECLHMPAHSPEAAVTVIFTRRSAWIGL